MSKTGPAVPFPFTYWVVPGKFLAGEHPVAGDPAATKKRLAALLDAGIRTFVDLTDEAEPGREHHPATGYRPLLQTLARERKLEVTCVCIPIADRKAPTVLAMKCVLDVVDRSLKEKQPVFAHCFAGIGRTGTVVGCYLKRKGLALDYEAIRKIAELRQGLPGGPDLSPHTEEQIQMVGKWQEGA
jgi:hypothetical protein